MGKKILELKNIRKSFKKEDGTNIDILDNINIDFRDGEIVGIVGRSGCGKSTLLRIITGLIAQTSGKVLLHGKSVNTENSTMSMVFQTFGLFPWLTIYENVAIGLRTQGLSDDIIAKKVSMGINLVGLSGFESAYPREISGGMRQRVGFARAIVMDPEVLILDEPFSALDHLTSQLLRSDLLDIWFKRSISSIKSIILVTHSMEEALKLCDKIIVLSSNPGRVIASINVNVPHPRDSDSLEIQSLMNKIYSVMTNQGMSDETTNIYRLYPQCPSINKLIWVMEHIKDNHLGKVKLSLLAESTHLTNQKLIPIVESLSLLKFSDINGDEISLSSSGNILLDADANGRNAIMQEHLVQSVDFIKKLYHKIQESKTHTITKEEALRILSSDFNNAEAESIFNNTINWVRHVKLFSYNAKKSVLSLFHKIKVK